MHRCGDSRNCANSVKLIPTVMGTEAVGSTAGMKPRHAGIPWVWN